LPGRTTKPTILKNAQLFLLSFMYITLLLFRIST
jgi:hypothetical protein